MVMPGGWFMWSKTKKNIVVFQKEKGNAFTLLTIFIVKSLQKEQSSSNLLLWPQSAGINLQSPQSYSTPWTLTLEHNHWLELPNQNWTIDDSFKIRRWLAKLIPSNTIVQNIWKLLSVPHTLFHIRDWHCILK